MIKNLEYQKIAKITLFKVQRSNTKLIVFIPFLLQEKEEKAKFKLESKEKLKDKDKDKIKDKDKEKVKDKEKEKTKDKEKEKFKEKDKDKKDRKLTKVPSTVTSGVPFEEIFTLGGESLASLT